MVSIEIVDGAGRVIRRYTSEEKGEYPTPESAPVPLYWYRKPLTLQTTSGMHRFLWDMRYQPLAGGGRRGGLPIAATPYDTVPTPNSIWAPPGLYTVKLTANGQTLKQPLTLRMDPRVKTSTAGLTQQFELSRAMYDGILDAQATLLKMRALRGHFKKAQETAAKSQSPAEVIEALAAFDNKAAAIEGGAGGPGGPGGGMGGQMGPGGPGGAGGQDTLTGIGSSLNALMNMLQAADVTPTSQLAAAVAERRKALRSLLDKWDSFSTRELAALNAVLKEAKLAEIELDR
jgi:hypothetical protein